MGQTGRRSIATHILAVKIALAAAHFHGFGVARQGPWITWVNSSAQGNLGGRFALALAMGKSLWGTPRPPYNRLQERGHERTSARSLRRKEILSWSVSTAWS